MGLCNGYRCYLLAVFLCSHIFISCSVGKILKQFLFGLGKQALLQFWLCAVGLCELQMCLLY